MLLAISVSNRLVSARSLARLNLGTRNKGKNNGNKKELHCFDDGTPLDILSQAAASWARVVLK
jgi:hypothetical protein